MTSEHYSGKYELDSQSRAWFMLMLSDATFRVSSILLHHCHGALSVALPPAGFQSLARGREGTLRV